MAEPELSGPSWRHSDSSWIEQAGDCCPAASEATWHWLCARRLPLPALPPVKPAGLAALDLGPAALAQLVNTGTETDRIVAAIAAGGVGRMDGGPTVATLLAVLAGDEEQAKAMAIVRAGRKFSVSSPHPIATPPLPPLSPLPSLLPYVLI